MLSDVSSQNGFKCNLTRKLLRQNPKHKYPCEDII